MVPKAIPMVLLAAYFFIGYFFLCLGTIQSQPTNGNAFGFIQNLTGGHKGEIVPGLSELKQYLQRFGYLDSEAVENVTEAQNYDAVNSIDYFDDVLESAIKAYQRNYNLNVTGTLDPPTVRQMMLPRCGFPDTVNGTTSFPISHDHDHNHDHKHVHNQLIHGVRHYSFFPGSPRWNKYQLTYRFVAGVQVPGTSNIRSIVYRAFQRWARVTRFTFTEVASNVRSDISIGFFRGYHGDNEPFDGTGGTIAHAYAPSVGWFHYDADEYWSENPNYYQMDLESVAVHEIGHLLGLDHSTVAAAIMYPSINPGAIKRELNADDINGIRALYAF